MISDDEIILQIIKNRKGALELLFFHYEIHFNNLAKKLGDFTSSLCLSREDIKIMMKANMMNIIKLYAPNKGTFMTFWYFMETRNIIKYYRETLSETKATYNNIYLDETNTDYILDKYYQDNPLDKYILKDSYSTLINKVEEKLGKQHQIILKMWSEGYSYQEISKTLNISLNKVNNSLQKCFSTLKNYINN